VLDGFDDEAVIAGEVEGARFAWGAEFLKVKERR
jgi:hypothetical protein